MEIEFYKAREQQFILTIYREDGSKTWSKLYQGIEDHDLAHYVVEKKLNVHSAFYGMVAQGTDIEDFENKDKQLPISVEALQVEYFVNLLQTDYWNASEEIDILTILNETLTFKHIPIITGLDENAVDEIKKEYHQYILKLKKLSTGEKFKLQF